MSGSNNKFKDEWIRLTPNHLCESWLSYLGIQNLRHVSYYHESSVVKGWHTAVVDISDKDKLKQNMIKISYNVRETTYGQRVKKEIWINLKNKDNLSRLFPPWYHSKHETRWTTEPGYGSIFLRPVVFVYGEILD